MKNQHDAISELLRRQAQLERLGAAMPPASAIEDMFHRLSSLECNLTASSRSAEAIQNMARRAQDVERVFAASQPSTKAIQNMMRRAQDAERLFAASQPSTEAIQNMMRRAQDAERLFAASMPSTEAIQDMMRRALDVEQLMAASQPSTDVVEQALSHLRELEDAALEAVQDLSSSEADSSDVSATAEELLTPAETVRVLVGSLFAVWIIFFALQDETHEVTMDRVTLGAVIGPLLLWAYRRPSS